MADITFDTYDDLKSASASWLHRDDLTTAIPSFVKLCEASMQRNLTVGEQELTVTLSIAAGASTVTLPTDYQKMRRLRFLYGGQYIDMFPMALAPSYSDGVTQGPPRIVSLQGSTITLHGPVNQAYDFTLDYYGKFTPLSATNPSNWILASHPDAYLYGTLLQAAPFLGTDSRLQLWEGAYLNVIEEINQLDFQKRNSQLQLVSDVAWGGNLRRRSGMCGLT